MILVFTAQEAVIFLLGQAGLVHKGFIRPTNKACVTIINCGRKGYVNCMEIMEIIDMMEETVDKAPVVPLSGKILIDKEDILDYIQEMRLVFPDELKEAKWVKNERQRILSEAETKSEEMIKNAEEKMVQMVDENEITRQAYAKADAIENESKNYYAQQKDDFDQYVNDRLNTLEKNLEELVKTVQEQKMYFNNN